MTIDSSQFHQLADDLMTRITDAIDEAELDLDYDQAGSVLELECCDGSKIVINKQEPLRQIWLATKFGGHHYDYRDGVWIDDRSGDEFIAFLSAAITRQGGETLSL
ncbi:iron donor protein CyaY [Ferrimonas marina]|uniref:Iron-sulfur cluster assembly protein CyaY n=1 Tax=Ferrimonas marina TaxID=299255 RepID=A0A1M5XQZ9_9GAMM|nr:iron donor protein CyaY [Ferrimonas marina]SHI02220.1 CyaY protein [Ferrimonas marina]